MKSTFARLGATAAASLAVFAFATPAAQAAPPSSSGANQACPGHAYCPTPSGPSMNGNENENSNKPPAGSVGKADAKNPPGQAPDGGDANQGYECDGNQGIGQSNPAHTGCATSSS